MQYSYLVYLFLLVFVLVFPNGCKPKVVPNNTASASTVSSTDSAKTKDSLVIVNFVDSLKHLNIALAFDGVVEHGNNRGPEVERFLASVKRKPGDSWCAAFVSFVLDSAKVANPTVRSGLARSFKLKTSIPASKVLSGQVVIPDGTIVIWEKGKTINGHIGLIIKWNKQSGSTIEGNTSSNLSGSQDNGDGVYRKNRSIQPSDYFRITSFTLVTY